MTLCKLESNNIKEFVLFRNLCTLFDIKKYCSYCTLLYNSKREIHLIILASAIAFS